MRSQKMPKIDQNVLFSIKIKKQSHSMPMFSKLGNPSLAFMLLIAYNQLDITSKN